MENHSSSNESELTLEQQLERLKTAGRIASRWAGALNRAGNHHSSELSDLLTLADKILALSTDENNHFSDEEPSDNYGISIDDLDFSAGAYTALNRMGIKTVGDLLPLSYKAILRVKNMGQSRVREVRAKLGALGITLREE